MVDILTLPNQLFKKTNGTAFDDPAFMENRTTPVHRWVPWIAGFSSTFVDSVLSTYIGKNKYALVLDPFAGVGTTLFEAALKGHDIVGFEINPYAALAAEAKLNAFRIDLNKLDKYIKSMHNESKTWTTQSSIRTIPTGFKSRIPFFSGKIEKQVLHALHFINQMDDDKLRDLFRVAFGSVMVSFSNYTYEPSLSSRPGSGKPLIDNADVGYILLEKLKHMRADISWLKAEVNSIEPGDGGVYNENFFTNAKRLDSNSVHLMITSPPYLNNYHYARNTRPQLYWLGLINSPEEQRPLEEQNFGTFWQIARVKSNIPLEFQHKGLERILSKLIKIHTEKGEYGGQGWANYAASYFNDVNRFVKILKRVLKRNGAGVIVVGNSILQGINVPVQDIMGDIGKEEGLILEGIYKLRNKRVGNSVTSSSVRSKTCKTKLDESAVIFRKQ